jgi:hypothetical protein
VNYGIIYDFLEHGAISNRQQCSIADFYAVNGWLDLNKEIKHLFVRTHFLILMQLVTILHFTL